MKRFILAAAACASPLLAPAATPAQIADAYAKAAGAPASAERGRQFFVARHGREWACASCHGEKPVGTGRHANTGKPIEPLAPAANPVRLTEPARVEKWLRRNCNDVAGRECTALEKADLVQWLVTVTP